jgi:excisionase family DNA binding protein
VEQFALRRWNLRTADTDAAWLGTKEAAQLLGVNRARVRQLVAAGLLPFELTPDGYAFRREQLLTVANARRARFHAYDLGASQKLRPCRSTSGKVASMSASQS